MARNRLVKKEFLDDPKVGSLPFEGRLLFLSLWIQADDTGHGVADPVLLKARTFPYDDISSDYVRELLDRMAAVGMVLLYDVDGQKYFEVRNFLKHQTINKPSKFAYPKPVLARDTRNSGSTTTPLPECYGSPTTLLPEDYRPKSEVEGEVKSEVKEKVNGKGKENSERTATTEPITPVCDSQKQEPVTKATAKTDEGNSARPCSRQTSDFMGFAGMDVSRIGEIDPYFKHLMANVFVAYRTEAHQDNETCNCSRVAFLEKLLKTCKKNKVEYPKGLLKVKKDMERQAIVQ